jgi:tripartite-type tricarboxylate transporter receptor subunit TctC
VFNMQRLARIGVAVTACALATIAGAQDSYPSKPIKIIAPVQPGGGVDLVARTIGERIKTQP